MGVLRFEALEDSLLNGGEGLRPGVFAVKFPMQMTRNINFEDLDSVIMNENPNCYYDNFLFAQRRLFELSKKVSIDVSKEEAYGKCCVYWSGGETIEIKRIEQFREEAKPNMNQLVQVLQTLQSLRDCVGQAAEASLLTKEELKSLKLKMLAFDKDSCYSLATSLVSHALEWDRCLVHTSREKWW